MSDQKLSFRKRKSLLKIELFNLLQSNAELDITANTKQGYYSLKAIYSFLNPLLDKYDIDLSTQVDNNKVYITFADCNTTDHDTVVVDVSKLAGVGRLPSMTNEVQSYGAELSYVRRYALTIALNINSTDSIEQNTKKTINLETQDKIKKSYSDEAIKMVLDKSTYEYLKDIPTTMINEFYSRLNKAEKMLKEKKFEPNTKQLYTVAGLAGYSNKMVKILIEEMFQIDSTKKLTKQQVENLLWYFDLLTKGKQCDVTEELLHKYAVDKFKVKTLFQINSEQYNKMVAALEKQIKEISKKS
ncbi:MAG: ERF family protein [Promethearchaeota archaeon]